MMQGEGEEEASQVRSVRISSFDWQRNVTRINGLKKKFNLLSRLNRQQPSGLLPGDSTPTTPARKPQDSGRKRQFSRVVTEHRREDSGPERRYSKRKGISFHPKFKQKSIHDNANMLISVLRRKLVGNSWLSEEERISSIVETLSGRKWRGKCTIETRPQ